MEILSGLKKIEKVIIENPFYIPPALDIEKKLRSGQIAIAELSKFPW